MIEEIEKAQSLKEKNLSRDTFWQIPNSESNRIFLKQKEKKKLPNKFNKKHYVLNCFSKEKKKRIKVENII